MTSTVRVVSCFLACVSMFVCSDASNALLSTTKPPTKIKSPTKITGNNVKVFLDTYLHLSSFVFVHTLFCPLLSVLCCMFFVICPSSFYIYILCPVTCVLFVLCSLLSALFLVLVFVFVLFLLFSQRFSRYLWVCVTFTYTATLEHYLICNYSHIGSLQQRKLKYYTYHQGNFQFFGAFCFPEGDSLMQFEIVTKERAPSDLRILFYDDEPSSFNMVRMVAVCVKLHRCHSHRVCFSDLTTSFPFQR